MTTIKTLQCNSCGGSLDKDNNCMYCGNRHQVTIKDIKTFKDGGLIAVEKIIQFVVERVDGKVKFTPDKLEVNKTIGMVRVQSNKTTMKIGIFTHNGIVHSLQSFSAYGLQNNISDVNFKNGDIEDISGFNFDGLSDDETLTVTMYPARPSNKPRNLVSPC